MSTPDLRRRLLVWRMALLSHSRRVRAGVTGRDALADDLAHMAEEAGSLAVELLQVELDGPVSDGPKPSRVPEGYDEAEWDAMGDTQPIEPLRRRPKA